MKNSFFVHIGAPRTGTSFLRKHIFPNIEGVYFKDKLSTETSGTTTLNSFFSQVAHLGEGDELSQERSRLILPETNAPKILISEEHLIWSVYHMMGNIGSRALFLKEVCPNAKIILTIRKQADYFVSIFKYFRTLESRHLHRQMYSLKHMLNIERKVTAINIFTKWSLPVGFELAWRYKSYSIAEHYFQRHRRHFIAADFSWHQLYKIYAQLFGEDNIIVLPHELLRKSPDRLVELLAGFMDASINASEYAFQQKVNTTEKMSSPFNSSEEEKYFYDYITEINENSNRKLDKLLPHLDLEMLGYFTKGPDRLMKQRHGFWTSKSRKSKLFTLLFQLREDQKRFGLMPTIKTAARRLRRVQYSKLLLQKIYDIYSRKIDQLRGVDFSEIVSTQSLGISENIACRYERTKPFEIKKILSLTKLPDKIIAIDFGSGKGQMLAILASMESVYKVYGVEICPNLAKISENNLNKLGIRNTATHVSNAIDTPFRILDECNLFYFYNPFPEEVFRAVIKRIEQSLYTDPRRACLIYFNPIHESVLESTACFEKVATHNNFISNAVTSVFDFTGITNKLN